MSTLTILEYPDNRLRRVAEPVSFPEPKLAGLVDEMAQLMYAAAGVGLAAIQVNRPLRLFLMDPSAGQDNLQVFINPEIVSVRGLATNDEGCLSLPGMYETVERPEQIELTWQDIQGVRHQQSFSGLEAVCIQHEIDHLDGKLFVDHISRIKRARITKRLMKHKSQAEVA
ncbi:MAG: peptide deformylase [Gammaproteobacteria bacterium]